MIGKKRAEAILESREKEGKFSELTDLERTGLKPNQITSIFKVSFFNLGQHRSSYFIAYQGCSLV
jgi:predicted nucleic acid-binding OB-fold protein